MEKEQDKKKKQDLGIFYTPQEVVDFIFEILKIWKNKEDKETSRWQSRKPKAHFPSVLDPACGEGIFLKTAITSGFTGYHPTEKTPYVFGVDLDGEVVKRWEQISILHDLFKGNKYKMLNHFHAQNGLVELPDKIFSYKTGGLKEFDAVVGNPPYGGLGIYEDMKLLLEAITGSEKIQTVENQVIDTLFGKQEVKQIKKTKTISRSISISNDRLNELKELSISLIKYEIWMEAKNFIKRIDYPLNINGVGFNLKYLLDKKEIERLKSFPVEILFVERFIQLAKPGGWMAVIVPDGILTNSNSEYVREFISKRAKIEAIVSLPRDTFKNAGTNAKTSILFLKKLDKNEKQQQDYPVFLSSVEVINKDIFQKIIDSYNKFYNEENIMDKSQLIQITKDKNNKEMTMVRVDKTLKEMMEEKPFSRLDINYWHPKFEKIYQILKANKAKSIKEIEGENCVISGDHVRKSRGESKGYNLGTGIEYYETKGFLPIAYDYSNIKECSLNAFIRLKTTKAMKGDILISCAGVGGVGKGRKCIIVHTPKDKSCTGDVFILRLKKINPYYCYIYLNSVFGKNQIIRQQAGTGTVNINSEQTLSILIPQLTIQQKVEEEYHKLLKYFYRAMDAKKNGDIDKFKSNFEISERKLRDLIIQTEKVILGESEIIN